MHHVQQQQQQQQTHNSATESDDDLPNFISKGVCCLGPPPWRYQDLLLFMGVPLHLARDKK
jgi:hypothetical protein